VVQRSSVAFVFQTREHLLRIGAADNLVAGARIAVRDCLGVQPEENVMLLTDTSSEAIAAAIFIELEAVGARVQPYLVHESQTRSESFGSASSRSSAVLGPSCSSTTPCRLRFGAG
jgi:hypothetical protein